MDINLNMVRITISINVVFKQDAKLPFLLVWRVGQASTCGCIVESTQLVVVLVELCLA